MTILNFNFFKRKKTTSFQKDIFLMLKGTFIAQIIGIIGSIVLAKIYGSESYGIFSLFISISSVLTILNTVQFDKCIVTINNKSESKNLMNSLFLLSIITSFIIFIIYNAYSVLFQSNIFAYSIIASSFFASVFLSFNVKVIFLL